MQRFISRSEERLEMNGSWEMDGTVAAELEGWLLKSKDLFPYFLLVAMEAGSLIRAIVLLLACPLAWLLRCKSPVWDEEAALKLYVFIACAGLRVAEIEGVGRAVLPRFLAEDVRARAWKVFSCCAPSRRIVVSALPRLMLQAFVRDQLGAQQLIARELHATASGRCTGLLMKPRGGQLAATCASNLDLPELLRCTTPCTQFASTINKQGVSDDDETVRMSDLQSPVVFHDGRLVQRPKPGVALLVFLWMPLGLLLALVRVCIGSRVPYRWWPTVTRLLGLRLTIKGEIPAPRGAHGRLLVCNHRTLLDPVFVSMALGGARPVTAATYSLSRLSEMLSPIHTVRLERDAGRDLQKLKGLIEQGRDVVVCPEGTTSREALLLRFSALFAQVSDDIVPVAIHTRTELFYGTSARGFKALDSFFFLMNPAPTYDLIFLPMLPPSMTCGAGGKSRLDVANHVQQLIASTLGFHCSSFTRPDKYRFLAGTDGSVPRPHRL